VKSDNIEIDLMATSKKSAPKPQKAVSHKPKPRKSTPRPRGAAPSPAAHFSEEVRESVASVRAVIAEPLQERKPIIHLDKVYLQGIKFEIASIRQVLERVSRQIDALDRKISEL